MFHVSCSKGDRGQHDPSASNIRKKSRRKDQPRREDRLVGSLVCRAERDGHLGRRLLLIAWGRVSAGGAHIPMGSSQYACIWGLSRAKHNILYHSCRSA